MKKEICLAGNPNSGKTTLFNALTGTYQKVGNWAGVTTEKKYGAYKKDKNVTIVDLPGVYSFSAKTEDEKAATGYLAKGSPDCVINVIDGTNLERGLYLTCLLSEYGVPAVIAINFADELYKNGVKLDIKKMEQIFGVPVVAVSALKRRGVDALMEKALNAKAKITRPKEEYYAFIEKHVGSFVTPKKTSAKNFTEKADKILLHPFFGPIILIAVITLLYFFTVKIGGFFGGAINKGIKSFSLCTAGSLKKINAPEWFISLFTEAVIGGVGTVLSFLPQALILFGLLTVIEESGYSPRAAFLTDALLSGFGLGGKSVIPLMLSCGCTVNGITAARTLSDGQKRATVFLSPFMPCGAKLAVFGWLGGTLFGGSPWVAVFAYFLGAFSVCFFGKILFKFKAFKGKSELTVIEVPILRKPSVKDVLLSMYEKTKDFCVKAGGVIFLAAVALWLLKSFGFCGYVYGEKEKSFLYLIGNAVRYVFIPLGFGSWEVSVSVISGLIAREAVIETLVFVSDCPATLFSGVYSAYAFAAFVLLSPPCIAALAAARAELKSKKLFAFMIVFQTLSAYVTAFAINSIGLILNSGIGLIFTIVSVIIIIAVCVLSFNHSIKNGCKGCDRCGGLRCRKKSSRNTTI